MRSSDHHGHHRRYLHHDMPLDPDARLKALERLVTEKGLAAQKILEHHPIGLNRIGSIRSDDALATRKDAWADAYRNTPHGQPVVLARISGY